MGQPSLPPQPIAPPPPAQLGGPGPGPGPGPAAGCQVRCAGCKMVLTVLPGLTEFVCPTCQLPQMLPPELMRSNQTQAPTQQHRTAPAHGIDPTKIQLPCANCKAILNVPHGLSRFNCPQCQISLAVDLSKISQVLAPPVRPPPHLPMQPPLPLPEEVNEVFLFSFQFAPAFLATGDYHTLSCFRLTSVMLVFWCRFELRQRKVNYGCNSSI